ncbi:MAG: HAD-IIIA family hydrolase [Crocinitomicaceae bacterium]|nr:HAD-IIIA family hydrolase [Crocinitomicaceae bacterium]
MKKLVENIRFLLESNVLREGEFSFKNDPMDYSLADLSRIAEETNYTLEQLFFDKIAITQKKHTHIKLLILDVDGVLTDGGMYYSENGDQMKKFNTKDGMAILHLIKKGVLVGIISSGFKNEIVKTRAEILKIPLVYVGREPKINVLKEWCEQFSIALNNVAIIGDDVNDLSVILEVGLSACPSDAVQKVKQHVDICLDKKGGEGCVREFIENYLLEEDIVF